MSLIKTKSAVMKM